MKTPLPSRRFRRACAAAVFTLICGLGTLRAGVTLGDTIEQCDTAFGETVSVPNATFLVCAKTRGYVKDGLSVLVGFNEKGIAEEFIYSRLPGSDKPTDLNEDECKAILEQYKDESSWVLNGKPASGPVWRREDNGAYASYVVKGSRLVILSNEGMAEHTKKFNIKNE